MYRSAYLCSFGLCCVEAYRPPVLRKGKCDPNTPPQKLFKKKSKNLLVKITSQLFVLYVLSIN